MNKSIAVIISLLLTQAGFAQKADTTSIWKKNVVGNLNLTQASFSNWEKGGDNSLAWQLKFDSKFEMDAEKWNWATTGKFELGFAKVGGNEARKSSDIVDIETVVTKKLGKLLNPFVAATVKSQFVAGFKFDDTAETKTQVSKFMDPGYFTQSAGIGYKPNDNFQSRLGFTLKETLTSDFPQYADDADTPEIEKTRIEPGVSSVTDLKWKIHENVAYVSKLNVFSDMKSVNRIDVLLENQVIMKVTKYLNVNVSVDVLYDKDVTDKTQLKEVLAIGLVYQFM